MRLIDIIAKDLRVVLRNRVALIFIFLMPIVLITILSFALGGVFTSDGVSIGHIQIAVVDLTVDDELQGLQQMMQQPPSTQNNAGFDAKAMSLYSVLDSTEVADFLSYTETDAKTAQAQLQNGEIAAVVTIPKGFTMGIISAMTVGGGEAHIDVLGAQDASLQAGIVASIVRAYTDTLSTFAADIDILIQAAKNGGIASDAIAQLDFASFMQSLSSRSALDVQLQGIEARKALSSFSYYSIAITCMFVLYAAGQGSSFLLTESQEKTLLRLRAAGISVKKLLLGKSVAVFFLCIIQLIALLGFSTLAFGLDWGNPLVFILISVCVAVSITGLGVLLMVLVYRSGNTAVGSVFQSVIAQVLALFGGSFLPLSVLPAFFSTVALFTPNGLAVMAYTGNVSGAPLAEILPYLGGSVLIGIVLYFAGLMLSRRKGGRDMTAMLWLKIKRMRQEMYLYVIMTVMALLLTFVFGNAMFGDGSSARRVSVVDHDGSAVSTAFIDAFDKGAYAMETMSSDDAEQAVSKGEVMAAIVIPGGFEQSVSGGTATVTVLRTADSADIIAFQSAVNAAYQSAVHGFKLQSALQATLSAAGADTPTLSEVQDDLSAYMEDKPVAVNYSLLDATDYDEKFAENIHYLMGFNIFFVMFSIVFTLSSLLEDKKLHTWNRIRISPLSTSAVLAGNFVPTCGIGLIQMAIVLFLGQLLFGINLGSALLPVFAVFAVFVLAASCLGLLLAVSFKAYDQMNAAVPVIIVGTSMLGGCMWSLSIVGSDILVGIGKCMPQFWALDAAENLTVMGADFGSVLPNIGILLGMALVLFALSMLIYNKKQRA